MTQPKSQDDRDSEDIHFPRMPAGWIPLEYIIMVKCLSPEGRVRYRETTSKTLSPAEALGMLSTMLDTTRMRLMHSAHPIEEED